MTGAAVGEVEAMWTVPREKGCSRQIRRESLFLPVGGGPRKRVWSWQADMSMFAGMRKVWRLAKVGSESCLISSDS